MSLASFGFLAFIASTIVAFHLSESIGYRRFVLASANIVFIASYVDGLEQVLPLLGFLLLGYACLQLVYLQRTAVALAASIAVVLVVYIFLKRFSFVESLAQLPFPYLIVGMSYILFRMLHLMVDASSGDLPYRIGPLAFFRYTCNFLCFVSGPIQRFEDFAKMDGVEVTPLDPTSVYVAFSRIVSGYLKFVVVAAAANYIFINFTPQLAVSLSVAKISVVYAVCAGAYTAYLYFNFSGYMDIVIGIGILLGQSLPENFDKPFSARSFLEFWQRWHMTLSEWFKLYVFNPFLMFLMTHFTAPGLTAYLGVLAFFVTFLIMGVWHGTTLVFVIYGLLMGAGASINKIWQIFCVNEFGKKRYALITRKAGYVYVARGLTFSYFAIALTCLWKPELPQFLDLSRQLGVSGICGAFALLAGGFSVAVLMLDAAWTRIGSKVGVADAFLNKVAMRNIWLAGRILAILIISSLFNASPDFVYKAF
jgi:D-alanyl-lipoteichoic acid acyltransferase DltB (MBOAT superfamily)